MKIILIAFALIASLMIAGCAKEDPPAPSYPVAPGLHKNPLDRRDSIKPI